MSERAETFIEQGIVLRRYPLRESDLIVRVLSEKKGKITAIARGAKRSKRRFLGGLDLFDCGSFELRSPRAGSELFIIQALTNQTPWTNLRKSYLPFSLASYALELTDLLAREGDPDSHAYLPPLIHLLKCLNSLPTPESCYEESTRFSLALLELAGFHPIADAVGADDATRDCWAEIATGQQNRATSTSAQDAFHRLVRYIEQLAQRPLKSYAI